MSEWRECKIKDIALNMADAPFGSNLKTKDYIEDGAVVLQGKNIQGRKCIWNDARFVSKEKYSILSRHHAKLGCLVFPKVGTIGKVGILTPFDERTEYLLSTNSMMLELNPKIALQDFIYYFFSSAEVSNHIKAISSNSVQPVFNFTSLKNYIVNLPPLPEQKAIASVLSSLDDKIDLLHRQNKTLETMAETLFRQWFVEDAGNWRTGILGNVLELVYGKALKEELRTGSGYPVVGSSGVVGYHSEYLVKGPGIVIGRKGTLGKVTYLFKSFFPIDTTYYIKSKGDSHGMLYEYFLLKTLDFENSDSAVPGLNRDIALSQEIKIPPQNMITEFNDICAGFFSKIATNTDQIRTLEILRDTLLPKLMSGELRVEH